MGTAQRETMCGPYGGPPIDPAVLREAYDKMDKNKDGLIDKEGLLAIVKANWKPPPWAETEPSQEEVQEMLQQTVEDVFREDMNGDGFLTFEDVEAAIQYDYTGELKESLGVAEQPTPFQRMLSRHPTQ